ncbi:g12736 [Coccomyxa viridis]|uniref:G12736 protein n=1 Tax=Coccomyxa viridis TaxID=1274662 RepID=A0ABP1GB25_9CHLO
MERLEIESASSDASSMILAAWPVDLRQDQAEPASPAGTSDVSTQSRFGKAALPFADSAASASAPQQSSRMGKQRLLEAVIQPGMQAHIQCSQSEVSMDALHCSSSSSQAGAASSSRDSPPEEDYHEVKIILRVPRSQQPAGPVRAAEGSSSGEASLPETAVGVNGIELREQTHEEALLSTIEKLRADLEEREKQRKQSADAAKRKAQECENLMRVVRELTASRSKLVAGKSVMAERFAELQQEYIKVLRIAELSRAASRSNLAKADRATNLAKQVEDDMARQKRQLSVLKERNSRLKAENVELRDKAALLDRLDMHKYNPKSACMLEFTHFKIRETY